MNQGKRGRNSVVKDQQKGKILQGFCNPRAVGNWVRVHILVP